MTFDTVDICPKKAIKGIKWGAVLGSRGETGGKNRHAIFTPVGNTKRCGYGLGKNVK